MSDLYDLPCLICQKIVKDYDPMMCCDGFECGCMGQPTEPCICSEKCGKALMTGIGTSFEERRIKAGIPIFKEEPE